MNWSNGIQVTTADNKPMKGRVQRLEQNQNNGQNNSKRRFAKPPDIYSIQPDTILIHKLYKYKMCCGNTSGDEGIQI